MKKAVDGGKGRAGSLPATRHGGCRSETGLDPAGARDYRNRRGIGQGSPPGDPPREGSRFGREAASRGPGKRRVSLGIWRG